MDWAGLMRVGLGVLRLPPEAFWAMTPREFAAAATALAEAVPAPMSRGDLEALRARYPDAGG
ncbi:MAG: phage tail assembly chaperone [Paracoccaceae bacterium]